MLEEAKPSERDLNVGKTCFQINNRQKLNFSMLTTAVFPPETYSNTNFFTALPVTPHTSSGCNNKNSYLAFFQTAKTYFKYLV